jgi:hypothetical protein
MDEADRLDPAGSGGLKPVHEIRPHGRLDDRSLVLKAVARSDLDQGDV